MPTTFRNQKLFCLNCGQGYAIKFPMDLKTFRKKTKAFDELHLDCEKTWTEPVVDQSKELIEKAMWWIENGEIGPSTMTMYNCLIGYKNFEISHPGDPHSFGRCYKLLETVPEWKAHKYMQMLSKLSKPWENLVKNWDRLTEMYEQNTREEWRNYKQIGMYELIQTLIY